MKFCYDYDVTGVIMGGGQGARLFPLTKDRSKPAVPLGAKYRLIDIPISNCLNSGLNRIFILTQFNSTSLHRHIFQSYHFDRYSRGFVEILAAQQSPQYIDKSSWYQGTADAVRKNLVRLKESGARDILILSGDQIYQMDYRDVLATHRGRHGRSPTEVTIAALLVPKARVSQLGILQIDDTGTVVRFVEKPGQNEELLKTLEAPAKLVEDFGLSHQEGPWFLANMGIYVFKLDALEDALAGEEIDFGRELLPRIIDKMHVRAHLFQGYWEDIGTISSFLTANLQLASAMPSFNFYNKDRPIYTRARNLPATKIRNAFMADSVIAEGCLIENARIENCLIGIRAVIGRGVMLSNSYVMGNDYYETEDDRRLHRLQLIPDIGIGDGTVIENAIVDKNVRIGKNVVIKNVEKRQEYDDGWVFIREGIVVVPRNGILPDGYKI